MKYFTLVSNVLVGLVFFVFGLNGFFNFIPMPPMSEDASTMVGVLASTGFMTVVKIIEVVVGFCILVGFHRPLMYVLIAPMALVIVLFELLVAKQPGIGILILGLVGYLIYTERARYLPIVRAN